MIDRYWVVRDESALPPPDAHLIGPNDKIPTPVDDRGLILIDELIEDVKTTVDPEFEWPTGKGKLSVHHFYHPHDDYPNRPALGAANPLAFCNLAIHKGLMPRVFENWLHRVTIPPPVPSESVRVYRVEAWLAAKRLFDAAQKTAHWQRLQQNRRQLISGHPEILNEEFNGNDVIGEAVMHEILEKNFRGFGQHMRRHRHLPPEHRLIDIDGTPADIAASLGRIVKPASLYLVRQIVA